MKSALAIVLIFAPISHALSGQLFNYAAARNGAAAHSNGDWNSPQEKHPASGAIDGTADMSRYANGGVWLSSLAVSKETPAILQITFPQAVALNRLVIYHLPNGNNALIDFSLEYRTPKNQFVPVTPCQNSWKNPIHDNQTKISTLTFDTVKTDSIRLVITKGSQDSINSQHIARAYVAEIEAYYVDTEQEQRYATQKQERFQELRSLSAQWLSKYNVRNHERRKARQDNEAGIQESPSCTWIHTEKMRTAFTGFGVGHIAEILPELAKLGFNSLDASCYRYAPRARDFEPSVKAVDDLCRKYNFRFSPWFAWYFQPDDATTLGRNCIGDLTINGSYRHAMDFRGLEMALAPCPLEDALWQDIESNVDQMALWSKSYRSIWGMCMDFEFYGTGSSRQSSDWYSYDFCFCDHCLANFLTRIASSLKPSDIAPQERYKVLSANGALRAYYTLLADEVRIRAQHIRGRLDTINPEFVLQIYGTPITLDPNAAEDLEKGPKWYGWFGNALAEGFGTKYLPCVFKPLDASDLRPAHWSPTSRMVWNNGAFGYFDSGKTVQQELNDLDLHVIHCSGFVICNETSPQALASAMDWSLRKGNGFWLNESWMLFAYRKDPNHPRPAWWTNEKESIEDYWKVLSAAVSQNQPGSK